MTIPATNYFAGRDGNPITLIVDHWVGAGTADGALAHFQNPAAKASAHYIIRTTGEVIPVVDEADAAYHATDWDVNMLSIGIEHECHPALMPSDALYAASAQLHRELSERYRIPLDRTHVREHRQIVNTRCPGTLDIDRIIREAQEDEEVTEEQIREIAKAECRAVLENEAWLKDTVKAAVRAALDEVANRLAA